MTFLEQATHMEEPQNIEEPDRIGNCAKRFSLELKHWKHVPDPELIFDKNRVPDRLKERYTKVRTLVDEFIVDIAEEVGIQDHVDQGASTLALSDARRKWRV